MTSARHNKCARIIVETETCVHPFEPTSIFCFEMSEEAREKGPNKFAYKRGHKQRKVRPEIISY